MGCLDRIRTSSLALIAGLILFETFAAVSPNLPHMTLHAQEVGPGGVPGGSSGGGGAVSSVFGRTGAVVAESGDYTAAQVTNAAATNAANTFTASQTIGATGNSSAALDINVQDNFWTLGPNSDGFSLLLNVPAHGGIVAFNPNNGYGDYGQYWLDGACYSWTSSLGSESADTGLCWRSAGVLSVDHDGTAAAGTLEAANLTLGGVPITQAATAPSGSCTAVAWVLSNDGGLTFCNGTEYMAKIAP